MFEGQEVSEEARKRMANILGPTTDAEKVGGYDEKNKRASVQVAEV